MKRKTNIIPKRSGLRGCIRVVALILCGFIGISIFLWGEHPGIIRLHVLANSDNTADQAVKLMVRDALLENYGPVLSQASNPTSALLTLIEQKEAMEDTCRDVLKAEGFDLPVTIHIVSERFPDKTYEDKVYPAGYYRAVKVIIGKGEGQNWWCVLYPPLCTHKTGKVVVRSRIYQWWQKLTRRTS